MKFPKFSASGGGLRRAGFSVCRIPRHPDCTRSHPRFRSDACVRWIVDKVPGSTYLVLNTSDSTQSDRAARYPHSKATVPLGCAYAYGVGCACQTTSPLWVGLGGATSKGVGGVEDISMPLRQTTSPLWVGLGDATSKGVGDVEDISMPLRQTTSPLWVGLGDATSEGVGDVEDISMPRGSKPRAASRFSTTPRSAEIVHGGWQCRSQHQLHGRTAQGAQWKAAEESTEGGGRQQARACNPEAWCAHACSHLEASMLHACAALARPAAWRSRQPAASKAPKACAPQ